jgi:ABC-type multidrug transport system fused ATPase/permease subunit
MLIDFDTTHPEKELEGVKAKLTALSLTRLIVFLALGAVVIVGISEMRWLLSLFFPLSFLFIYLIIRFNRQKDKQAFLETVLQIRADKEKRLARELSSFDAGDKFRDKNHPFANDLDLFGDHSLFQLINHTVNEGGKAKLAQWMLAGSNPSTAQERYAAITELSGKEDFLLNFEALGKAFWKKEKSKAAFYQWLKAPALWKSWYIVPAVLGPVAGISLLAGTLFAGLPVSLISLLILLGMFFLSFVFVPLMQVSKQMPDEGDLKTLTAWARQLEGVHFENEHLKELQKPVIDGEYKASEALKALEQQSFMVQSRINLMYLIFNMLFWVDFAVLMRLEKWKKQYASHIQQWDDLFNEWQALVSLAAFTADEKLSCEMTWTDSLTLEAEDVKHPLIPKSTCVGNDFSLLKEKQIVLLTGSNMSGKTTFMRTLGINIVLANLGLNPCAKTFVLGPFQLFTSMRNTDNLGENVSSFYAELARIRELLVRAEAGVPIFFLLDEILKGTNTTDRIMGSEALIRQLISSQSKGIISTHDIELSELSTRIPSLTNASFHSEIKENEILFDYKIKTGPCPSFNAYKLMELMGIRFAN